MAKKPMQEWAQLPIVQTQLHRASEFVGRKAMDEFQRNMGAMMRMFKEPQFESPLEQLFWLWWGACEVGHDFHPYNLIGLEPQVELEVGGERYRLDFVLRLQAPYWEKAIKAGLLVWPKIAVEVDGHEFHERTPEQVARRDSRDRALQQAGWLIFHYSWAEFTTNPERCVLEVYDLATTAAVEMHRKYSTEVPYDFKGE